MDKLKAIGAGIFDGIGSNRNKPPPDDTMVACKKQLNDLSTELAVVQQQFSQYAQQVVEAAEAAVTLSKSIGKFYSKANHPGRTESVNTFKKVQEDIANRAVNTFHISVENGLVAELTEWCELVKTLTEKIKNAESTRLSAHNTQNRLIALQNEHQEKKAKKQGIFGGNREQDLEELQQRITEATEVEKSLTAEYEKSRSSIAQQVKQLMEKRYRYFDRIYVQILECQAEYFQHAAVQSKRFQRDIDYYRKQYPKTSEFRNSNGNGMFPQMDKFNKESFSSSAVPNGGIASIAEDTDIKGAINGDVPTHRRTSSKKKVPTHKPPPSPLNGTSSTTTTSNSTQETSQNNTQSTSPSQQSSSQIDALPEAAPLQNKAQSSPPQSLASEVVTNAHRKKHRPRQQSSHDMLSIDAIGDIGGDVQPKPPINKQDSLLTAIIGNSSAEPMDDHLGLFNLGNPHHNDLLNGFGFDDASAKPAKPHNNPKGQYPKSTSAISSPHRTKAAHSHSAQPQSQQQPTQAHHDEDDIFGDFFAAPSANSSSSPNKARVPHHSSTDSTTDWMISMHNPSSQKKQNGNNLEQQMQASFNAPSYGGGAKQQQQAVNEVSAQSPRSNNIGPVSSSTSSLPSNGAATELSEHEKAAMVNLKLSAKGQQNAQMAYDAAMAEREEKEQAQAKVLQEKEYWKDTHEQKLNEWEFDNTVRRNIRNLIGKLPDVLPPSLNWKPIPMTKLLNDADLKKGYYKAVRVVHPDKSIGRGDSVENQVICDYVFQALEQAFNTKFG